MAGDELGDPAGATNTPDVDDFRALADNIPNLAWIADGTGLIFWYNRRWFDFTGTTLDAMRGWGWKSVHHPDHVDRVVEQFSACLLSGELWEDTFPLLRADGEWRWFVSRAQPIHGRDGRIVRWFGTNTEITDRIEAERAVRRSEARFRTLIDAGSAVVWVTNLAGQLVGDQSRWTAFTGLPEASLQGAGWLRSIHPDDREDTITAWTTALQTHKPYAVEHRMLRRDGEWRVMEARAVPIVEEDGSVREWVGVHYDITDRRRAEAAIEEAREAAEEANRAKSTFIANMSHELRTPLSAVIGYSEMLEEEVQDLGQEHLLADLGKINANARHLLSLISDVLDISKIEANRVTIYPEDFDVRELVEGVQSTTETLARRRGNTIELEVGDDVGTMRSDLVKVRQCLFNFVSNAVKFTENGRIVLRVERASEGGESRLRFSVSDTGIGMTAEQQTGLFRRFAQADASTTRRFGGTGLGLAITRGFARLLGGDIALTSEAGQGSTFNLSLPASLPDGSSEQMAPEIDGADPAPRPADPARSVLVVDDDRATRDLLERFLHREGFVVHQAADGRDGLELARLLHPRVILLDVMMPQMDGWAVLSALKNDAELADIPVVMVSFVNEQSLACSLGASEYLIKPIEWTQLKSAMDKYRPTATDGHVLIVDDDPSARERLSSMLVRNGMSVHTAVDGLDGLRRVAEAPPSLVLLDLMMPNMDGFAFLHELRGNPAWQAIPVVVLTAKDVTAEEHRLLQGQVDRVMPKGGTSLPLLAAELRSLLPARATQGVQ